MKLLIASVGAIVSLATMIWWHFEVTGIAGDSPFSRSAECLLKIGTGDCGGLWLVGLHQENQIAGAVFYIGICIALVGLLLPRDKKI